VTVLPLSPSKTLVSTVSASPVAPRRSSVAPRVPIRRPSHPSPRVQAKSTNRAEAPRSKPKSYDISLAKNKRGYDIDPLDVFFGVTPEDGKAMRCGYHGIGVEGRKGWKHVEDFQSLLNIGEEAIVRQDTSAKKEEVMMPVDDDAWEMDDYESGFGYAVEDSNKRTSTKQIQTPNMPSSQQKATPTSGAANNPHSAEYKRADLAKKGATSNKDSVGRRIKGFLKGVGPGHEIEEKIRPGVRAGVGDFF